MYDVKGEFPHYQSYNNKGSFALKADKTMNPFTWAPPIKWKGFVNGTEVSFIQVDAGAISKDDFDFTGFPEQLNSAISYIIEAIDDAMRVMD